MSSVGPSISLSRPPEFQNPSFFSQLRNGKWYCSLCVKNSNKAYKVAFNNDIAALAHEAYPDHLAKVAGYYSWDNKGDAVDWGTETDDSIPSEDPEKEEKEKRKTILAMVDTVNARVSEWQQGISMVGGAYCRRKEIEVSRSPPPPDSKDMLATKQMDHSITDFEDASFEKEATVTLEALQLTAWGANEPTLINAGPPSKEKEKVPVSSASFEAWLDMMSGRKGYRKIRKTHGLEFFRLPTTEKIRRIERTARELSRFA